MNEIFRLLYLGVACGAISMVLTKAAVLNSFHDWLEKRFPKLEEMLSCPWCTSHWVALFLVLVYRPLVLKSTGWLVPVDYIVTIFVMTVIAAITARVIYSAYQPIMEK